MSWFAFCSALCISVYINFRHEFRHLFSTLHCGKGFQFNDTSRKLIIWNGKILVLAFYTRVIQTHEAKREILSRNPYLKNCISVVTKQKMEKKLTFGLHSRLSRVATNVAINTCMKIVR